MTVRRYHPDGTFTELTGEALAEWEADQAVRKLAQLPKRRETRRALFRQQADARIAQLVGRPATDTKEAVLVAQMNMVGAAIRAARAEAQAGGDAGAATTMLDNLDTLYGAIEAVRAAENAASAAVAVAGLDDQMTPDDRIAEVEAVPDVEARLA